MTKNNDSCENHMAANVLAACALTLLISGINLRGISEIIANILALFLSAAALYLAVWRKNTNDS